jgi:hypothetical protein
MQRLDHGHLHPLLEAPRLTCLGRISNLDLCGALQMKGASARIEYKCLVPIYVFPEMKLLYPKNNYNVLSPSSYAHISVGDLYMSRICLSILLQGNMWADPGNI